MSADVGWRLADDRLARRKRFLRIAGPFRLPLLSVSQSNENRDTVVVVLRNAAKNLDDLVRLEVLSVEVGDHQAIANVAADRATKRGDDFLSAIGVAQSFCGASQAVIGFRHAARHL